MVITMAKLRMAHASTHGARKPPGPKRKRERGANDGNNNGQATHGARKPPGPILRPAQKPGPALLRVCLATAHNSVIRQQVTARMLGPTGLVLRFLPGHVLCGGHFGLARLKLLCRSYWVEGVIFWLTDFLCDSFRYVLNTINTRCIKYLVFDTFSFQIQ